MCLMRLHLPNASFCILGARKLHVACDFPKMELTDLLQFQLWAALRDIRSKLVA